MRRVKPGDFLRICDYSGFAVPASRTQEQYDGLIVRDRLFDYRHPQETIRARRDDQSVKNPRPRSQDVFVGPLTTELTEGADAGDTLISVESSVRMFSTDMVTVTLTSGNIHRTTIFSIPDSTHLILSRAMPESAPIGAVLINYSAVADAEIG